MSPQTKFGGLKELAATEARLALIKATNDLIQQAEIEGADILGMKDYSTAKLPEIAFEMDVLKARYLILETKMATLERELFCLQLIQHKPPLTLPLTLHIKRLMNSTKRVMSRRSRNRL